VLMRPQNPATAGRLALPPAPPTGRCGADRGRAACRGLLEWSARGRAADVTRSGPGTGVAEAVATEMGPLVRAAATSAIEARSWRPCPMTVGAPCLRSADPVPPRVGADEGAKP
jgi:hypothetical protein